MSNAFTLLNEEEYVETSRFCLIFDKFFDCLNTRRAGEGREKRKPDLEPYRSVSDIRLTVSIITNLNKKILKLLLLSCMLFI